MVKDADGNPYEGATVNFSVTEGSVSSAQATTNASGIASVTWTLGETVGEQTLEATAFESNGTTALQGSPLTFNATSKIYISDVYTLDGYQVVDIGNQTWMTQNLAEPSGTFVPNTDDGNDTWAALSESDAAYCQGTYGYLYTWNAALTVCPSGWHLPSDTEWTELTDYLGGISEAGRRMKETGTTHWNDINIATNRSHFSALPGGYRTNYYGTFNRVGNYGYWWSATENSSSIAWIRRLFHSSSRVVRDDSTKSLGYSVRCLRD